MQTNVWLIWLKIPCLEVEAALAKGRQAILWQFRAVQNPIRQIIRKDTILTKIVKQCNFDRNCCHNRKQILQYQLLSGCL